MKKISILMLLLLSPAMAFAVNKNKVQMVTYFPATYVAHTKLNVVDPYGIGSQLLMCTTDNCDMYVGSNYASYPAGVVPFYADTFRIGAGADLDGGTADFSGTTSASLGPLVMQPLTANPLYLGILNPGIGGHRQYSRFIFGGNLVVGNMESTSDQWRTPFITPGYPAPELYPNRGFSGTANANTVVMLGVLSIFKRNNHLPLCSVITSHERADWAAANGNPNADDIYENHRGGNGTRIGTGVMRWRKLALGDPKYGGEERLYLTCETCYKWQVISEESTSEGSSLFGDGVYKCRHYTDESENKYGHYVSYPSHGIWGKDMEDKHTENLENGEVFPCDAAHVGRTVTWKYCYPFRESVKMNAIVLKRIMKCVNSCDINNYTDPNTLVKAEQFCSEF